LCLPCQNNGAQKPSDVTACHIIYHYNKQYQKQLPN
jgi:hypothetical protein